jgi:hypothetical protein
MKLVQPQPAIVLAVAAFALCAVPAFAQAPEATEAPPAEAAVPTPEPPKVNIASAVTCQILISQFDDSVAAARSKTP